MDTVWITLITTTGVVVSGLVGGFWAYKTSKATRIAEAEKWKRDRAATLRDNAENQMRQDFRDLLKTMDHYQYMLRNAPRSLPDSASPRTELVAADRDFRSAASAVMILTGDAEIQKALDEAERLTTNLLSHFLLVDVQDWMINNFEDEIRVILRELVTGFRRVLADLSSSETDT